MLSYARQDVISATEGVKRRLSLIHRDIVKRRIRVRSFLGELRINRDTLYRWESTNSFPRLDQWVYLGRKLRWDLTHDINYCYAENRIPPEEIRERLERIGLVEVDDIASRLHRPPLIIRSILYGREGHTCLSWCTVVRYIAQREAQRGYKDALKLED